MFQLNLSNPYFFWSIIIFLLISVGMSHFIINDFTDKNTTTKHSDIVEQSYNKNKKYLLRYNIVKFNKSHTY